MKEVFKYTFTTIAEWKKFLIVVILISILTLLENFPVISIVAFIFEKLILFENTLEIFDFDRVHVFGIFVYVGSEIVVILPMGYAHNFWVFARKNELILLGFYQNCDLLAITSNCYTLHRVW